VPKTITSTTNAIKSDRDPALWVALGAGAATAGALAVSEDGPAVAASAAAGLTVSEAGLTVAAGAVAAAACVAEGLRGWADRRGG
jgi:hypothetical protein